MIIEAKPKKGRAAASQGRTDRIPDASMSSSLSTSRWEHVEERPAVVEMATTSVRSTTYLDCKGRLAHTTVAQYRDFEDHTRCLRQLAERQMEVRQISQTAKTYHDENDRVRFRDKMLKA